MEKSTLKPKLIPFLCQLLKFSGFMPQNPMPATTSK